MPLSTQPQYMLVNIHLNMYKYIYFSSENLQQVISVYLFRLIAF